MTVKIVGLGRCVTDTRFKFEGAFAKDLRRHFKIERPKRARILAMEY